MTQENSASGNESGRLPENVSLSSLAHLLGITPQRISQLVSEGVLKRSSRGQYPLISSVRSYLDYVRDVPEPSGDGELDPGHDRARWLKGKADLIELQVAEAAGGSKEERALRLVETVAAHVWDVLQQYGQVACTGIVDRLGKETNRTSDRVWMYMWFNILQGHHADLMVRIYHSLLADLLIPSLDLIPPGTPRGWEHVGITAPDGQELPAFDQSIALRVLSERDVMFARELSRLHKELPLCWVRDAVSGPDPMKIYDHLEQKLNEVFGRLIAEEETLPNG